MLECYIGLGRKGLPVANPLAHWYWSHYDKNEVLLIRHQLLPSVPQFPHVALDRVPVVRLCFAYGAFSSTPGTNVIKLFSM
jgi:hypothetical protein